MMRFRLNFKTYTNVYLSDSNKTKYNKSDIKLALIKLDLPILSTQYYNASDTSTNYTDMQYIRTVVRDR